MLHKGLYEKVISLGLEEELAQSDRLAQTSLFTGTHTIILASRTDTEIRILRTCLFNLGKIF